MSRIKKHGLQHGKNLIVIAAACFFSAFVVLFMALNIADMNEAYNYAVLLGLMAVLLIPVILYAAVNGLDIFEPLYIISLTYVQVFAIAPWIWLAMGRTSWMGYPLMHNLPRGSLYFALGYITFLLGYCLKRKSNNEEGQYLPQMGEGLRKLVVKLSAIILALAFSCSALSMHFSGKGLLFALTLGRINDGGNSGLLDSGSTQMLFLKMFINMLIPAFMLLYVFQKNKRWLLVPVFAAILLFCLASAFRYRILILLFAPILFNYLKNKKRPRLSSCVVIILAIYIIVSVVGAWRNNIRSGTEFVPLDTGVLMESYMPNIEIFYPYYRILDIVPEIYPHSLGKGYLYAFTIMVPRALWPTKPYPPAREIMTLAFGENGMLAGPAYPNTGEFYVEFGVAGILVGMFIFGCFARWSYSLYKNKHGSLFQLITYAMLFPFYLQIVCRGYFPQIFLEALFTFAPVAIVAFIANRAGKGRKRRI